MLRAAGGRARATGCAGGRASCARRRQVPSLEPPELPVIMPPNVDRAPHQPNDGTVPRHPRAVPLMLPASVPPVTVLLPV